jgi:hypothetical protein
MKHKLILALFSLLIVIVANAQNVGIGTTTPKNKLEINSAIANNSGLRLTQLAGQSDSAGYAVQLINGNFITAGGITADASGIIYVSDFNGNKIYKVTSSGTSTPFVTTGLNKPFGMAFDPSGNLYVCDNGTNSILKISAAGVVVPFASGFVGPTYIVYYANNLYVSNSSSNSISVVSLAGVVKPLTTTATFSFPEGLVFDANGLLYVANNGSGIITKINIATGASATFATVAGQPGSLIFDASGNLLVGADALYSINPGGVITKIIASPAFSYGLYADKTGVVYGVAGGLFKLAQYFNTFLSVNNSGDLVLVPNPVYVSSGNSEIDDNNTINGNDVINGNTKTNGNDTILGNLLVNRNATIIGNTTSNGNDTTNGNLVINGTVDNGNGNLFVPVLNVTNLAFIKSLSVSGSIATPTLTANQIYMGTDGGGATITSSANAAISIGTNATASGTYSTAMGHNVSTNNIKGAFTIGDSDPENTGVTLSAVTDQFVARFWNGYYLLTSNNTTRTGVKLNGGDNSWSAISDSTKKEKIIPVDGEDFLNKISKFKLSTWNYKGQDPKTFRHYGPMAQDFHNAFGKDALGTIGCDTLINQQDFLGVSFIAIQALEKRTQKIEELQKKNTALQQQVDKQQQDNLAMKEQMHQQIDTQQQQIQTLLNSVASLNKQVQALADKTNNQNTVAVNK